MNFVLFSNTAQYNYTDCVNRVYVCSQAFSIYSFFDKKCVSRSEQKTMKWFIVVDFSNYSNFSEREENSVLLNNLFFWESIVHSLFLHGRSCSTMNKTYAATFNGNALFFFVHFYEEQFVP